MWVPGAGAAEVPEGCCAAAIPTKKATMKKPVIRDILAPKPKFDTRAAALRLQGELDANYRLPGSTASKGGCASIWFIHRPMMRSRDASRATRKAVLLLTYLDCSRRRAPR